MGGGGGLKKKMAKRLKKTILGIKKGKILLKTFTLGD